MQDVILNNEGQEIEKMSIGQRIIGIFTKPSETFEYLDKKPSVGFAILYMSLVSIITALINFSANKTFQMDLMVKTYKQMGMDMSIDTIEQIVNIQSIVGIFLAPLMVLLFWFIGALVTYIVFIICGGDKKFSKYLSVSGYTFIIASVGTIITAIALNFSGDFLFKTPITSIASLLDPSMKGTFMYTVLSLIEVFTIWSTIVSVIGYSIVSKLRMTVSATIVTVLYIITIMLSAWMTNASLAKLLEMGIV